MASHPTTPSSPCRFYLNNTCYRGDSCHFPHTSAPNAGSAPAAQIFVTTSNLCEHFSRGYCRFSSHCRFSHVLPKNNTTSWRSSTNPESRGISRCTAALKSELGFGQDSATLQSQSSGGAPPSVNIVGPCKYFLKGSCNKGNTCSFPHILLVGDKWRTADLYKVALQPNVRVVSRVEVAAVNVIHGHPEPTSRGPQYGFDSLNSAAERTKYGCKVQYSDGASIHTICTAFESQFIILSKIPPSASHAELLTLAELFGDLETLTLDKQADALPIARPKYGSTDHAIHAIRSLDGMLFQSYSLVARFDVRAVEDGSSTLRSTKVKISWYAPSSVAWAHYSGVSFARKQVERLNGMDFNGRKITASFQTPSPRQRTSFSVELKSLPPIVTESYLRAFCHADSVSLGRQSYNPETATQAIRSILSQFASLETFETLPLDPQKPKMMAFAQFTTADAAENAVRQFHGVPQLFLRSAMMWLELIHSIKYTIPSPLFGILRQEIDALRDGQTNCKFRYYELDETGAALDLITVRIFGPEPKVLGRIKSVMERLLTGELFVNEGHDGWDDYFATPEGIFFLRMLHERTFAFVKCDPRLRTIRIHGLPANRDSAKQALIRKLIEVAERKHVVRLDKTQLRALVTGKLQHLVDTFGADKVVLDVTRRTLNIQADGDDVDRIREAVVDPSFSITSKSSTLQADGDCPICFCEAIDLVKLPCDHKYCKVCLQHLLQSTSGVSSVKCVSEISKDRESKARHCDLEISYTTIRALLSPGEEDRLLATTFLSYIHSRPDEFRYCPTPDCRIVYRVQRDGTVLRCPSCLARICAACHVEFHEGQLCMEYRDNLSGGNEAYRKWREQNDVKSCPKCKNRYSEV